MQLNAETAFEHLAEVRRALTDLLDAVDNDPHDDLQIESAQRRAEKHAAAIGDPVGLRVVMPVEDHQRLQDELEDWLRLVSLATAAVSRNRESAEVAMEQVQSGKRSLDALDSKRPPGRNCDLSA